MHNVCYHTFPLMGCVEQQSACTPTHISSDTHTHTHTLAAHTYTSIVPPWRCLTGKKKFLQTQQVTYRPSVCSVQDLSRWQSSKTGRGPLEKGWRDDHKPIMCSYKRVQCSFEVYGFQTKTEEFIHKVRQSFFLPFPCADVKRAGSRYELQLTLLALIGVIHSGKIWIYSQLDSIKCSASFKHWYLHVGLFHSKESTVKW